METLSVIVILSVVSCVLLIYGVYLLASRRRALLADRVETYAGIEQEAAQNVSDELRPQSPVARLMDLLLGRNYVSRLEADLARADVPMRAAEYLLARLVLAALGVVAGLYLLPPLPHPLWLCLRALVLAVAGYFIPSWVVRYHQNKRRDKFVRQLADALMLLTNSLRSGYSFLKGLELVAKEMSDPISKELHRTLREVNLGATIEEAMLSLGRRVTSKDLDIVISAYLVQKEVGGNLTEIMQKVAETIRERLRIQGDIKVLTAQGRLSGMFVGALPIIVGLMIWFSSPSYFYVLVGEPKMTVLGLVIPYGILLLLGGLVLQMIGAYLIYKIVSIKV